MHTDQRTRTPAPSGRALQFEYLDPDRYLDPTRFARIWSFLDRVHGWRIGWHYAVDLSFIFDCAQSWEPGSRVLDAGGGRGPAQYLLAECGFDVTNVDLAARPPDLLEKTRYQATFAELDSFVDTDYSGHLQRFASRGLGAWSQPPRRLASALFHQFRQHALRRSNASSRDSWRTESGLQARPLGTLRILRGNLASLPELEESSFDAVVSLSALEHVPLSDLGSAVDEIRRLVKPTGSWAITTSGTERPATWFHEPSRGYCFSADDLQRYFGAGTMGRQTPGEVMRAYRNCDFLKERLAPFYRRSGENGMPWGIWSPSYVPVGIRTP